MKKQKILALFSILGAFKIRADDLESMSANQTTNNPIETTEERESLKSKKLKIKQSGLRLLKQARYSSEDKKADHGKKQIISLNNSDRAKTEKHVVRSYSDWKKLQDSDLESSVNSELEFGEKYRELAEKLLVDYLQSKEQYKVTMAKFGPLYQADLKMIKTFKENKDYNKLLELTRCQNQIDYQEKKINYQKHQAASAGRNFDQVCSNLKAARENLEKRKIDAKNSQLQEVYSTLIDNINNLIRNNPMKKKQIEINKINREAREKLMELRAQKYGLSPEKTKLFTDLSMGTKDKIEEVKAKRIEELKEIDGSFINEDGNITNKGKTWLKTPEGKDFSKKYNNQMKEVGQSHEARANEINPDRMKNGKKARFNQNFNNNIEDQNIDNEESEVNIINKENAKIKDNINFNSSNNSNHSFDNSDASYNKSNNKNKKSATKNNKKQDSNLIINERLEALREINGDFVTANGGISKKGKGWLKTKEGKAFNAEYTENIKQHEQNEKKDKEKRGQKKKEKIEKIKQSRPQTAEKRANKYKLDEKNKNEYVDLSLSTGKTMDLIEKNYIDSLKKQNSNFVNSDGKITKAGKKWLNSTDAGKKLSSAYHQSKIKVGQKHEEEANKINSKRQKNNSNKTKHGTEKNNNTNAKNMEKERIKSLKEINASYVTAQGQISTKGKAWLKTAAGKSFDDKYVKTRKAVVEKRNQIRNDKRKKIEKKKTSRPEMLAKRADKNKLEGENKTKYVNLSNQTKSTMDSIEKDRLNALKKKNKNFVTADGKISKSGKKWLTSTEEGKKLCDSFNQKKREVGKKHEEQANKLNPNRKKSQEKKVKKSDASKKITDKKQKKQVDKNVDEKQKTESKNKGKSVNKGSHSNTKGKNEKQKSQKSKKETKNDKHSSKDKKNQSKAQKSKKVKNKKNKK